MQRYADPQNGRSAVVTGGASGIGKCTVRLLIERRWKVVFVDSDIEGGKETAAELSQEGEVHFIPCDVSQSDDVCQTVATAAALLGKLDVLVNNAACLGPENLTASSDSDLARVLAVNLFGPLCLCKHVIERMIQTGGGVIVNVASIACLVGSPAHPAYAASKSGLIGLTKSLARQYARNNIRVNCISPGSVWGTNLLRRSCNRDYSQAEHLALTAKIPIGRILRPAEVAEMILMLVSPVAAGMTGANIVLDGGETLALR